MSLQYIEARHAVIGWRNRWLAKIDDLFSDAVMCGFKSRLIFEIDMASLKNMMFTDDFVEKTLDPIILAWKLDKLNSIILEAEEDLASKSKKSVVANLVDNNLADQPLMGKILDIAGATASTGVAIAAVPVTASLSIASASGVVGFLGATTVAAPIVVTGAVVIAAAGFLARNRISNIKSSQQQRLKESIDLRLYEDVVFNKDGIALRQILRKAIEQTAGNILKELSYKGVNHAA